MRNLPIGYLATVALAAWVRSRETAGHPPPGP
jgi:hypothetical protein